ncbi:sanguinarine reductase-like [Triticum dicoccoides]|uniref:sanguinarine reductase-like n=1 Tax=Triticum dicoccoides TaxID=85692 RepID=UPI00188F798C|nr:sanguinarine reductase-like [Triticum dicoccoides]
MATAHLSPALAVSSSRHPTSKHGQPPIFAQPGGTAVLRSCSLPLPSRLAASGRGGWRLAAAVEPRTAQQEKADASSRLVLVVGGTGGVGQLLVASLLSRKIKTRLLLRNPEKAAFLFGKQDESVLQVYEADTRNVDSLNPEMFEGVTHVVCTTGTTAFPSKRWDGDNTPERVDWDGVRNFVSAMPQTVKRLVLVSSIGVTKYNEIPWSIMNLFGVLKYKKMAEDFVRNSGIPFTIIRPGRLTDGPYTSYDLNTLVKATAGERRAVEIGQGDKLVGEASRLVVAEACIQALDIESTQGKIYEISSVKGEGPGSDQEKWKQLFAAAESN